MKLGRARAIGSEVALKLTRELDLSEARYRG
jgi:CPA1 family monovalent cation:H+ antiporter